MKKLDCSFGMIRIVTSTGQLSALVLALWALTCPPNARAVAFRLPSQDPEAVARGEAVVATADNPSAIYYNPAGITQLEGNNVRIGMYNVSAGVKFTSPGGVTAKAKTDIQPVPEIYYVYTPKDSIFSYGLGIYCPYGLGLDWGDSTPFRTLAEKGKVMYACINPVVAVKVTPKLSFAVGPTINYSQAEFKRGIGFFPGDNFEFKGDGTAFGFTAGIRYQPIKQLAFGASYRHQTDVNYEGYSTTTPAPPLPGSTATHGTVKYPQYVIVGVSYRPTDKWNFEVDVDWTDWSPVKQLVFEDTAFGNIGLPLDYRPSYMYEAGITRQLPNGYFVSVGYFYSDNTSPNNTFNPIVPDANLQLGSVGFGHHGKRWDWAAAYHFGYNGGRTVQQGSAADGKYETFNQAVNVSVGFRF